MIDNFINRALKFGLRFFFKRLGFFYINSEKSAFITYEGLIDPEDYKRISSISRFTQTDLHFLKKNITITDNIAFIGMVSEIFIKNNYMFLSDNSQPYIIDCGANIGLASIFFKRTYPRSRILALEPDPYLFKILSDNITSFGFENVVLENSAAWVKNDTLFFSVDKSWGGHLNEIGNDKSVKVNALDFKDFLVEEIDFLKIDIEGAEVDVLWDSKELIVKYVKNLFFEWHSISRKKQQLGKLLNYFEQNGFRYHIKEASPKGAPFIEKRLDSEMDTQLDCFLYKIK